MLTINFSPFHNLETQRLLLRRVTLDDAPQVFKLRSNPESMKYVPRPLVENIEQARDHINLIDSRINENQGINWAITMRGNNELIGIIGHYKIKPESFRAEVGYMVLPEFAGKGISSEALSAVVDYGFDTMKLHSIEAIIDPDNLASARVLEKNRFRKEGHFRENEFYDGRFIDSVFYSRLKSD